MKIDGDNKKQSGAGLLTFSGEAGSAVLVNVFFTLRLETSRNNKATSKVDKQTNKHIHTHRHAHIHVYTHIKTYVYTQTRTDMHTHRHK